MSFNDIFYIVEWIHLYEKWTYDFARREMVFYTCWYWDGEVSLYKPKAWIKVDFKTFMAILMKKNLRKNFCRSAY